MPYARPTFSQLLSQVASDISSALPGADALLRFSNLGILGRVLAALTQGLYGYLDWIARQSNPFTATGEFLEAWAALKGIFRKPATASAGYAQFAGVNTTVLPAGSAIARSDGFAYVTTTDATVADEIVTAPIRAAAGSEGAAGNANQGVVMSLAIGVAGIGGTGAASSPIVGGADVEKDDALRGRMLQAYANPPQGGSVSDYIEWATGVPGVSRAWIRPNGMGAGSVVVLFMMDNAQAEHGGFPQGGNGVAALETRGAAASGDQLTLANALFPLQPVTALVYGGAPAPNTLDFTIMGLSGASSDVRAAINNAIDATLLSKGSPGGVVLSDGSAGGVTNLSDIEAAIASVDGSAGFVITAINASAGTIVPGATGNITSNAGALPVRGVTTFL